MKKGDIKGLILLLFIHPSSSSTWIDGRMVGRHGGREGRRVGEATYAPGTVAGGAECHQMSDPPNQMRA